MLLSCVFSISPTTATRIEGFYGRALQAWWLNQIRQADPALANLLHTGAGPKAYTVSSLIVPAAGPRGQNGETHLLAGTRVLMRFTSLSAELSGLLLERIIPNLPRRMEILRQPFWLDGPMEDSLWWGTDTFENLSRRAAESSQLPGSSSVTLHFSSPTAFRAGQVDQTLPTPELVWRSLWQRWNAFAPDPLQIDPLWPDFAKDCIVVSDFQIRSMKVAAKNSATTGSTGKVTYRLLAPRHCGKFAPYREGAEIVLNSLAEFALYSGVGHHTTTGMGQARVIPPSSPADSGIV